MAAACVLLLHAAVSQGAIDGITGTSPNPVFNLSTGSTTISAADGGRIFVWGFANGTGVVQYPGPTLIVKEGDSVTVNLTNNLSFPVSIVFPGISNAVTATGGTKGLLAQEAAPGGSVSYSFTASRPGTYMYHSGTEPDLQVEMGLVGAIIVRPSDYIAGTQATYSAYGGGSAADSGYDREYLFLLSEMDYAIHRLVEFGLMGQVDTSSFWPVYWFINGRTGPDTMEMANVPWLPAQPYNCMPIYHPSERVLLRLIGGGRDLHPYHTHGNHTKIIAKDGRLLQSAPGSSADLAETVFTVTVDPGSTVDGIFTWTGHNLGWDFYGHGWDITNNVSFYADRDACVSANPITSTPGAGNNYVAGECPGDVDGPACDHCKPFPVRLPVVQDLTLAATYSGSPFLGGSGFLPPDQGGFNANGGFFFMWHSHNENEIVNNDVFPGGMMTMTIIEHPSVVLPAE